MIELKAYKMVDEKYCTDCVCVIPSEVYLKKDADEVIAELKEERRWRKCCEGLPLAQQRVLFLAKYKTDKVREWIGNFCHIDGMKADFAVFYASAPGWGCEFPIDEVIGWMPMPSAPKEDK